MASMLSRDGWGIREQTVIGKSQPVEIVGVDTEKLDQDDTFPDAYAFYISLSGRPDFVWQTHLAKWDSALERQHRKISVENNRLRLVCVYGDNIQLFADYTASLVDWVNERVAEHNKKIASIEEDKLRKQQADRTKQEHMLQELKRVTSQPSVSPQEVTVKKLTSVFENDIAAYERYRNSALKITGYVNAIERNYIVLADHFRSTNGVLCVFDKERSHELTRLKTGQMITVAGEFEGSMLQLSMRHCTVT